MFGPLLLITFIKQFLNSLIIFKRSFLLTFLMANLAFLYFFRLTLPFIPREVINPFPGLPKLSFDSEDVIFIFSRLSDFNGTSKVTYFSLPLISLCYLTLRRPKYFIFSAENKFSSPVNISSQKVFRVEKP